MPIWVDDPRQSIRHQAEIFDTDEGEIDSLLADLSSTLDDHGGDPGLNLMAICALLVKEAKKFKDASAALDIAVNLIDEYDELEGEGGRQE